MTVRLGLDLDGVLFDFNTAFVKLAQTRTDKRIPLPSDTWPQTWDYLVDDGYLDRRDYQQLWKEICRGDHPGFWSMLPRYSWSRPLLRYAVNKSQELYFITSRCGPSRHHESTKAVALLMESLVWGCSPVVAHPTVLPVDSHHEKIPIINALRLTHYVDDRDDTLTELAPQTKTRIGLWSMPWNQQAQCTNYPNVTRLHSPEEFDQWLLL